MKKVLIIAVLLMVLLLSTTVCYATSLWDENLEISPYYVGTQSHVQIFTISSSGLATMNVSLTPFNSTTIDAVKVTLVIKNSSGVKVYNKTHDMEWSSLYGSFKTVKDYQLSTKGVYEFQATYKCYKDGSLLETINSSSIVKSYS